MATQTLTTTPTALTGVNQGQAYTIQFRSSSKSYIQTTATQPTDSSGAFIVGTNAVVTFKRTAAESVWVWTEEAGGFAVYALAV